MALLIPIQATANQSLTVQLGDDRYVIEIKVSVGCMAMTIERNEVVVIEGSRVLAGEPVIPYHYLEAGNFILLTQDDALPDWQQFGITQSLVFLSEDEIKVIIGDS